MEQPAAAAPTVVHVDDVAPVEYSDGPHWGAIYQPLTPALDALPGRLGMNLTRVAPGRTACPFHTHAREDEIFYILSGRGVLRYGEALHALRPGHCIACPAGTGIAHQIANVSEDEDLVYLCIGPNDPHEVCTYPDSAKVLVRALKTVGRLQATEYMDGEAGEPRILALARAAAPGSRP